MSDTDSGQKEMKKINMLLLIVSLVVMACNNSSGTNSRKSEAVSQKFQEEMFEFDQKVLDVTRRVDNNFWRLKESRSQRVKIEESLTALTEGSDEYIKANNDLIFAQKEEQKILDDINSKYRQYTGYNLSAYSSDGLVQSSCALIKEVIREEMLKEYVEANYY